MDTMFTPLEELRKRFITGWMHVTKNGTSYEIVFEDGVDDVEFHLGTVTVTEFRRHMSRDFGIDSPIDYVLELFKTMRSPERRALIERLVLMCATQFGDRFASTVELTDDLVRAYRPYATQRRPDLPRGSIGELFAVYVLDPDRRGS